MSTDEMTAPATWAWFNLSRHDDPEGAEPEGAESGDEDAEAERLLADAADDEPEPDGADQLGDAGKKALDRMKSERAAAKKAAAAEKKRADNLARKVAEFEDRDKTEAERLASRAEAAEKRAEAAVSRALKAEVRALAAADFADPEDAAAFLDLPQYAADGEIDTDGLREALDELLERKPHLRRAAPAEPAKPRPKPDPGQGSRQPAPPTDFRKASREDVAAELAKFAYRQRS